MSRTAFLMYHRVGGPAPGHDPRYVVREEAFRAQMEGLRAGGYAVTSVGAFLAEPENTMPRVVLTFDDGSDTDWTFVAPLLAEYQFGATFYVVPGYFGRAGFLSETSLVDLARRRFEIGSHSMT